MWAEQENQIILLETLTGEERGNRERRCCIPEDGRSCSVAACDSFFSHVVAEEDLCQ